MAARAATRPRRSRTPALSSRRAYSPREMRPGIVLTACLFLFVAAVSGRGEARAVACPANLASQLASTGTATQLLTVVAATRRSTLGSLSLWRKSGECWLAVDGPWTAHLGRKGVSENKHEGDKTTP